MITIPQRMGRLQITAPNYGECTVNNVPAHGAVMFQKKLFHGDLVDDEDYSLQSSARLEFRIGGVLKLKNTYTFEKGDVFEFVPINWRYPKFLVRSQMKKNLLKKKEKVTNYFVVIQFKEWTEKLPRGTVVHSIGPVYETDSMNTTDCMNTNPTHTNILPHYEVLFYYYPTMTIAPCRSVDIMIEGDKEDKADKEDKDVKEFLNDIFTIDPKGCEDMDDAVSFDVEKNRVGIHITDLTVWEKHMSSPTISSFSTVYAPHKNIHMFSEQISTQLASLRAGERKDVLTCWIDVKTGESTWEVHCIRVTKNLTYEEAETHIQHGHPILTKLWEHSQTLGESLGIPVTDTHKMIEVYMVYYNQAMAGYLKDRSSWTIYRAHQLYKQAFYTLERQPHEHLELPYYTHATSPIRRYADFLVQKLFHQKEVFQESHLLQMIQDMNVWETNLKRLYRMWDYTKAADKVENGKLYPVTLKEIEDSHVVFSCEEWKILISMRIPFVVETGDTILVYGTRYTLQKEYRLPLYVVKDTKHTVFHKIFIEFPK